MTGDDVPDRVVVACPECDTAKPVDFDKSHGVVSKHNRMRHEGETVAGIRVRKDGGGPVVLPHPEDIDEDAIEQIVDADGGDE